MQKIDVKLKDDLANISQMMKQLTEVQLTHKARDDSKIRILCLDGGGVKGVSSLRMLKEIMIEVDRLERLGESEMGLRDQGSQRTTGELPAQIKPCQYFDLICGTSTGGLIALMLGRLEYVCILKIIGYDSNASADRGPGNREILRAWKEDL